MTHKLDGNPGAADLARSLDSAALLASYLDRFDGLLDVLVRFLAALGNVSVKIDTSVCGDGMVALRVVVRDLT